jgi:hypothetical protein
LELIRSFVEDGQWEGTLGRDVREKAKDHLKSALKDARILESKAFVRAIERAISPLDDADTTYEQFGVVHGDISSRIGDELHGLVFLFVQSEHARPYARDSPLFGVGVQAKFLCATSDVEEGGKCLALDRSTAGTFRLIRCLEAGIRAMSRCLAIPDPTTSAGRSWFNSSHCVRGSWRYPGRTARLAGARAVAVVGDRTR